MIPVQPIPRKSEEDNSCLAKEIIDYTKGTFVGTGNLESISARKKLASEHGQTTYMDTQLSFFQVDN